MKKELSDRQLYERSLSEEDVLGTIRAMLEVNGARVFRAVERVPKCYRCGCWLGVSEGGIPDLWGWFTKPTKKHPGLVFPLMFFMEIKKPGKKLRLKQAGFIERAVEDGIIAFKAESWGECVGELRRRGIELTVEG